MLPQDLRRFQRYRYPGQRGQNPGSIISRRSVARHLPAIRGTPSTGSGQRKEVQLLPEQRAIVYAQSKQLYLYHIRRYISQV